MPTARTDVLDPETATPDLVAEHAGMLALLRGVGGDARQYRSASDDVLLELTRVVAQEERVIAGHKAMLAGEIARRSSQQLGMQGLAQRAGHRTPEELLRVTTGSTLREAKAAVGVGLQFVEATAPADPVTGEVATVASPWMSAVVSDVAAGSLSIAQADAVRRGLGSVSEGVSADVLGLAAEQLRVEASKLDADRLLIRAQELRDELDEAGVADREHARREQRAFRIFRQPDGMTRAVWIMDPETAAVVSEVYDRATSPKLGGPRFVDATMSARAATIERDPRTPAQLASDVMLELLRNGYEADPSQLVGVGAPAVRVLVTRDALTSSVGRGHIEGQTVPVSLATVERMLCSGTSQDVIFDSELHPLDLGRSERLFSRKQRIAMAARDGGCMFPGCNRPPSWTEAHHINFWDRDLGETNIDDGILLCRHHHLLIHSNGWEIFRGDGRFWLRPPVGVDRGQIPIRLESKSAAYRELTRERLRSRTEERARA